MQNTDHQQSLGNANAPLESECDGSKTKQSHRGAQLNESDIYMSNYHKNGQTPYLLLMSRCEGKVQLRLPQSRWQDISQSPE
jgi:hypothetical protein